MLMNGTTMTATTVTNNRFKIADRKIRKNKHAQYNVHQIEKTNLMYLMVPEDEL
jgi:hypothetical protein